jgi:hypothetical protein
VTGYGGVDVYLHSLITELGGECPVVPLSCYSPSAKTRGILWIGERVEPRSSQEILENRKIHNSTGKHPKFLGSLAYGLVIVPTRLTKDGR